MKNFQLVANKSSNHTANLAVAYSSESPTLFWETIIGIQVVTLQFEAVDSD